MKQNTTTEDAKSQVDKKPSPQTYLPGRLATLGCCQFCFISDLIDIPYLLFILKFQNQGHGREIFASLDLLNRNRWGKWM